MKGVFRTHSNINEGTFLRKQVKVDYYFRYFHYFQSQFHCLIAVFLEILGQDVYYNYLFPTLRWHKFEINLSFLIKPFSYMTKKVWTKM